MISNAISLDLRPNSLNRGVKMDRQRACARYYNITGRKIAIERSGDPNAALFDQTAGVHGSGDAARAYEVLWIY